MLAGLQHERTPRGNCQLEMDAAPVRITEKLEENSLDLYLTDPTFVEYLNSFLLLPAFSNKVFYNSDTGYFELVNDEGLLGCFEDESMQSSSAATLFIPDDSVGPSLDKKQSWNWIIKNRLPLFQRSDIYSEYKICKKFASYIHEREFDFEPAGTKYLKQAESTINRLNNIAIQEIEEEQEEEDDLEKSQILPNIKTKVLPSSQVLRRQRSKSISNSDLQLNPLLQKQGGECRFKRRRSLSEVSEQPVLHRGSRLRTRREKLEQIGKSNETVSGSLTNMDDYNSSTNQDLVEVFSSKSGMSAFWKFLKGTAGERNWLFWLDAERVKYFERKEQARILRELHEKYFLDSSNSLELSPKLRHLVTKSYRLNLKHLSDIQEAMVAGLIEYWCPRFLLHHRSEQIMVPSLSDQSSLLFPNVFRLYSASSPIPSRSRGSKDHMFTTPQTPSQTPTFRRIHMTAPVYQTSPATSAKGSATTLPGSPATGQTHGRCHSCLPMANSSPTTASRRRKGGYRGSVTTDSENSEGDKLPTLKQSATKRMAASASRYSQLAKYSTRCLPDPNSQCASRMEGSDRDNICKSHCTILSMSGTPTHAEALQQQRYHTHNDMYKALFHCLVVENRKAGGYFQHFLGQLHDKVYINSLLFWREVQEYKALFVGRCFSPCTVEMKSKAIFGRYISEGGSDSIKCSDEIRELVSFHLKPAYEDLFDLAEELTVEVLLEQWVTLCSQETSTFQQLDKVSTSYTSVESSQRKYSLETISDSTSEATVVSPGSKSPQPIATQGPYQHRHAVVAISPAMTTIATSLNDIISNPIELEYFKVFLNDKLAAQDLMCWMDIEVFRGVSTSDKVIRNLKAKKIRKDHLNKNYYFGPNSPVSKETQRMTMQAGGGNYGARLPARPSTPVLREVQKHVRARLEKKWLAEFMMSPEFVERNRNTHLSNSWDRRMSMKVNQLSVEHSFLHSHEALHFRMFLNQKKTGNFERYLRVKAQSGQSSSIVYHPRENIEFWQEVQKYKAMCHVHTRGSTLLHKVKAIMDCYLCSTSPPELQIDVPLYLVEHLKKKDHLGGPYLFREAQAAVFSALYNGWKEYQNFVADRHEDKVKKAIDVLKKEIIQQQKQKREKEENERLEEESKKMRVPRFETAEEREQRIQTEREMAEFGPATIEFRLSSPNPSCHTYFTTLPDKFYVSEGDKTAQSGLSQTSLIDQPSGRATPAASLPLMKLKGVKPIPCHIRERLKKIEKPVVAVKEPDVVVGGANDDQDSLHKENCNDMEEKGQRRGGFLRGKGKLKAMANGLPRVTIRTINMKMSNIDKGEAYAYGNGIIEERSSFLEITSES